MENNFGQFCLLIGIGAIIVAIRSEMGYSQASISAWRGELHFRTYVSIAIVLFVLPLAYLIHESQLPVFQGEGTITKAIYRPEFRGVGTTYVWIKASDGASFNLNASGSDMYFRAGEHVKVLYRGYTGRILQAQFISSNGTQEGIFKNWNWKPLLFWVFGLFVIRTAYKVRKRDPEGREGDR